MEMSRKKQLEVMIRDEDREEEVKLKIKWKESLYIWMITHYT